MSFYLNPITQKQAIKELYKSVLAARVILAWHALQSLLPAYLHHGKVSAGLISELVFHLVGAGSIYGPAQKFDIHSILETIGSLEMPWKFKTTTKPPSAFKHPTLKGLYHKHHFQSSFLPKNLINQLRNSTWFEKAFIETLEQHKMISHEPIPLNLAVNLAVHTAVDVGFKTRIAQKRLTGEWIVYATVDKVNYYLTLASHEENDEDIRKRVESCFVEFPELKSYLDSLPVS